MKKKYLATPPVAELQNLQNCRLKSVVGNKTVSSLLLCNWVKTKRSLIVKLKNSGTKNPMSPKESVMSSFGKCPLLRSQTHTTESTEHQIYIRC